MRHHFPCERGCTVELGRDVPAYVADPSATLLGYCLLNQRNMLCGSRNPATQRLCACVPDSPPASNAGGRAVPALGKEAVLEKWRARSAQSRWQHAGNGSHQPAAERGGAQLQRRR